MEDTGSGGCIAKVMSENVEGSEVENKPVEYGNSELLGSTAYLNLVDRNLK